MAGKIMGRQSTGAALMQAIANSRPEKVWCYTHTRASAQQCARTIAELGSTRSGIAWIPYEKPERLAEAGLLYRPDPGIGQHAWHRLARSTPRAYSLCGITQTISSHGPMSAFVDYLTAPVESWDAVICTSTVSRDAIRYVLEQQAEYLRERHGATRFSLPQLPLIPLGIHTEQFIATPELRAASRMRLGLADDEVAVLYAGRLIVHGKAHPLPMYLALEEASKGKKVVLIQAGKAPNSEVERIYTEEPKLLCPSVRVIMVDGGDFELYRATWAAADIFTSLSDNFQETYGLTPVEAMAAGLPVVVSDWNGYRDTIRDGIDGFRIPTLTLRPGMGGELADRHEMGIDNFDAYSYFTSQLVAVDVSATAQAYRRLIDDPGLRRQMGAAGARRAREVFDWSIVFRRYQELWAELAERRRSDAQLVPSLSQRRRPDRADPFSMFATYPTHKVGPGLVFRRRPGVDAAEITSRRELASISFAKPVLPGPELIASILSATDGGWTPFQAICAGVPSAQPDAIASALTWMTKVGAMDFRSA